MTRKAIMKTLLPASFVKSDRRYVVLFLGLTLSPPGWGLAMGIFSQRTTKKQQYHYPPHLSVLVDIFLIIDRKK